MLEVLLGIVLVAPVVMAVISAVILHGESKHKRSW